ncbi:MAG: COX15/CtaA family protein [Verrucomicrobiae bacterium]|nr:COX15/CtaA family protein [Verrucomicrobiae bacterium]
MPASEVQPIGSASMHRYVKALAVMTVLLIWWGAATTTRQAGMAFADWPLSLGSVNPPGWLKHMVPFLEHSHRLLATMVGLMTLILFGWTHRRNGGTWIEFVLLFVTLAIVFSFFIRAGAERQDPGRKHLLLAVACAAALVPVIWLVWSWLKRGWNITTRLSALALLMVTTQAILGGLRVTEISDTFAVIHGCLAQGFFCVVILIGMLTSPAWADRRAAVAEDQHRPIRIGTFLLVAAIFTQLILGALMRHHHRAGLADTGVFLTAGKWFPGFDAVSSDGDSAILLLMFAHKYWALAVFSLGVGLTLWLWTRRDIPVGLLRHSLAISGLLVLQIALGVTVLLTGSPEHKRFWVTNFHVINGLALLATAFALAVRGWTTRGKKTLLADSGGEASSALPQPAR